MNKKIRQAGFLLVIASSVFTVACTAHSGLQTLPPDGANQVNPVTKPSNRGRNSGQQQYQQGRRTSQPLALVAIDLVSALAQIPEMDTGAKFIRMPPARSDFDRAVSNALRAKGYRVNSSSTRRGSDVMTTTVVPNNQKSSGIEFTYIIAINKIFLRRTYSVVDSVVAPNSSLFVRGADPELIRLDDELFLSQEIRL